MTHVTKWSPDNPPPFPRPSVQSTFRVFTHSPHPRPNNQSGPHRGDFLGPTPILMTIHPAGRMSKTKKYGGGESLGPLSDELRQPAASPCLGLCNYIPTKHYPPREHSSITEEWRRRPLDAVRFFCKSSITYEARLDVTDEYFTDFPLYKRNNQGV